MVSTFSNVDTGRSLYEFVRGLLEDEDEDEPFSLRFADKGGMRVVPRGEERLVVGLGMVGRVLVNFYWEDGASARARGGWVVKEVWRQRAKEIEVREVESGDLVEESEGKGKEKVEGKEKEKGKGGMPKWLKLPGKK